MPIIKSARKRVRVARKATVRNVKTKRSLKTALKAFHTAVTSGKGAAESHKKAQSAVAKAGKKGVMHKNKVARKQRQLAAKLKASGGKPAAKKTTAKTTTKKAAPAKKTTTKKTVAKKAPAKKPAAKKTAAKKTTKK